MYYQVIHDHVGAFALSLDDLREPSRAPPFKIHTFGAPAHRPPIRCAPTHATFMRDEFKELKRVGLIRSDETPWAAACFCVPKPNSLKFRVVIDYRLLNMITIRDSHPLPHARDIIMKLRLFLFFLKMDLKSGFHQQSLNPDSQPKSGVCTQDDLVVWSRLPFGVRNGPPAFQRGMT